MLGATSHAYSVEVSPRLAEAAPSHCDLSGMGLSTVDGLSACPALKTLILSFNKLTKIDSLGGCGSLERLVLSFNAIRRLEGLKGLQSLQALEVDHNSLARVEELTSLKKYTPNLQARRPPSIYP